MPAECRSLTEAVTISTLATCPRRLLPDSWGQAIMTVWRGCSVAEGVVGRARLRGAKRPPDN
jgi:hypothetical protein